MKRLCITCIGILVCSMASATAELPVKVLMPGGVFHGDEIKHEGGDGWWGLVREGDGFALRETRVTLTRANDPIVDNEGEKTGKNIVCDLEGEVLYLFKGGVAFKAGAVQTINATTQFLFPGEHVELRFKHPDSGRDQQWTYYAAGVATGAKGIGLIEGYTLAITDQPEGSQASHQALYSVKELDTRYGEGGASLLWVGDLDRDGKPDLLMNLSDHYNVMNVTLFLSSLAKNRAMLEKAGELITTGC